MTGFRKDASASGANGGAIRAVSGAALIVSVLILCLFSECSTASQLRAFGSILGEVGAALTDPGTQWMVFTCASAYFLVFVVLGSRLVVAREDGGWGIADRVGIVQRRWGLAPEAWLREPDYWVAGLIAVSALAYTLDYPQAVKSTQALTLLGGATLGQGAAVWALKSPKSKVQSPKSPASTVMGVLIALLLAGAIWRTGIGQVFQYRGQARWSGPWDNPNTFGVLMGAGAVLALGWVLRAWRMGNGKWQISNLLRWLFTTLLVAAAGAMGVGLVKSYSRGAWVAVLVGLAYLAWQSRRSRGWQMANGKLWGMAAVIALLVIGFWSLRQAEGAIARRAYSIANANDFSWRNRVAAYEGALAMLADKPWLGFGWNQPERVYTSLYCPAKVDESMAIQLNDYFILGTTLGVPALVCFAMYVGLSLNPKSTAQRLKPGESKTTDFRLKTLDLAAVCRAGAVVLAVGFWFDGGLFKLATGATFWTLLELGRE